MHIVYNFASNNTIYYTYVKSYVIWNIHPLDT